MAARAALALLILVLAACGSAPKRVAVPAGKDATSTTPAPSGGGLYAPHISDGGPPVPPDISAIPEPVPQAEPRSRYGNRSPYTVLGRSYQVLPSAIGYHERGTASWYGTKFHGRATSSLEPYDMYRFTAAHKSLPLPSYVRVTNLDNGRSVVVRVNDRGPFHGDRLIDLSYVAAVKLGVHIKGTAPVEVVALDPDDLASEPLQSSNPAADTTVDPNAPVYLQVGSFADHDNARRVHRRLRDSGIPDARIFRARVNGQSLWRVRAGPVTGFAAIQTLRQQLQAIGFPYPQLMHP
ncbi:MAG: septal ring lytic transglycosylase RlpA family protein [Xanthomonadaceae bacterium]|nr:septal ring lytic transglycosylase RlpA family protein [Xanthomonadaceae bacterium]MDP2186074.1 septal ring lytic transglycosylase RlpA family protein [Xanthomonadales bacterium]MDZ4117469.1 septal ring lytic transglycosylase RlpA family protein [Xanthomonadaceae bacterium]MDZ4378954.1 septal ring lytic transglycosylase RlpA family protein [Xanthomonadaceae bacterium]